MNNYVLAMKSFSHRPINHQKKAMDRKKLVCIMVWLLMLIANQVRGARLSRKENLELEKELKLLNKPSIKTIKTKYGDIYDCVDFYKQPAFDNPLLKNHNFHPEMRPSVSPKWRSKTNPNTFSTQIGEAKSLKLKDGGCPNGTVPIRKVTKDYLIQLKHMSKHLASSPKSNGLPPPPGTYYSVVESKSVSVEYKGIGGLLSVYNVNIEPSQYSASQFILQNGVDLLKFGLMVNSMLNQDNKTRLFQYLEEFKIPRLIVGNQTSPNISKCYDTLCRGFVSVRQDIPIDVIVEPVSKIAGPTYEYNIFVYQDAKNGNWWLEVGKSADAIGFWPQQIFSGLATSANYIAVGGEAYSPDKNLPLMGNGRYPYCTNEDITLSSFCHHFVVVDTNFNIVDPKDTQVYSSPSKRYNAFDRGWTPAWGRLLCFGGPN